MTTTTLQPNEVQKSWHECTDAEKAVCIAVHVAGLKLPARATKTVNRLFELGRPQIVFGYENDKPKYCRIAAESVDVMKVIIRQYL